MSGLDLPPINGAGIQGPRRTPLPELPRELRPGIVGERGPDGPREPDTTPFGGVLADSLDNVRSLQNDVREKVESMVKGEGVELHDVLIAGGKSEVAFNLMLEVRNKLVEAWEKLSRSTV